jgi:hypothetical protein
VSLSALSRGAGHRPGQATGRAALVLLALCLAAAAKAEPERLAGLAAIAARGEDRSLDYAKAMNAAALAAADLPSLVKLKSTTLTASYTAASSSYSTYSGSSSSSSSSSSTGFALAADIPVVEQLGLSASVKADKSGSVSASLSPLAHSDTDEQARVAYDKAVAAADEAGGKAGAAAVKAALAKMSLDRQLATAERAAELKKEIYEAAKAANVIDPKTTTLDDLVIAMKDWTDARTALSKAQSGARAAETALYAAIGSSKAATIVEPLDADRLAAALTALSASLGGVLSSGPAQSYALKAAALDARSAAAKAKATWAFEPDLSLGGGVAISSAGAAFPTATVKLALSLDDLKGEKRSVALTALDLARRGVELQKASDDSAYEVATAAAQAAMVEVESRRIARDQAAELAAVADLSAKEGSFSALEDETAAQAQAEAEDGLYQALVDAYSAWLDLAALAGRSVAY